MKRLFAYLLKTRLLSREVVKAFVDAKLIYQEGKHNNIVFVGTDAEGKPRSASLKSSASGAKGFRMTVSGSDPDYGFCWRGGGENLFVFEAATDLMSFITLYPKDWERQNYIALDGLSPKPMLRLLQEQGNVSEIFLCLDNDPAGIEACDKFRDLLLERGYTEEQIWPLLPTCKDWNECLKAEEGFSAQPAQPHPKENRQTVEKLKQQHRSCLLPMEEPAGRKGRAGVLPTTDRKGMGRTAKSPEITQRGQHQANDGRHSTDRGFGSMYAVRIGGYIYLQGNPFRIGTGIQTLSG